jgi:hypothetical protein
MANRRWMHVAHAATALLGVSQDAKAWYFPEHVVIAHDGFAELPSGIRDVVRDALGPVRRDGLEVCSLADVRLEDLARRKPIATKMVRSEISVDCVPYSALPALAGDHASSVPELRSVLSTRKGIELTSAVAYEWGRFRDAVDGLPNTSLERMSFVHALDVDFYFIDPGYELRAQGTRAHFADAGRPLAEVAREVLRGSIDNALGQFLVHHLRSLQLAARHESADAILEHAFALHFIEDAFSAGHLVMTQGTWGSRGNARVRARHDYFNAKGLLVERAMSVDTCHALATSPGPTGLLPCWTTSGDGYLAASADASDRLHVAHAVAKVDLEFAIALDGARVLDVVSQLSEPEQARIAELIDPAPWWTVPAGERGRRSTSGARATVLVRDAMAAVELLAAGAPVPAVAVGGPAPSPLLDAALMTGVFELPAFGGSGASQAGSVGGSLVRPVLAEWPASEAEPSTLDGEAMTDHGFAVQLLASASVAALFPRRGSLDLFAPAVGLSGGFSYRWGTYLPGRQNRPLAELNVGISEALHYDSFGRANGKSHVTSLDQELRWPVAWELLTSYVVPLDLRRNQDAGTVIVLGGVRVHELLTDSTPVFWGGELEMLTLALSRGHGSYPLYSSSPELRFYLGAADAGAANKNLNHGLAPTFGITFTGGYATFL